MTKNIRKMEGGGRQKKIGKTQQTGNEKVREELVSSSSGGSDEPLRSFSTSPGAPMKGTRCQTRQDKAPADKQEALKTPSRVLTHDDGENSSTVSTLSLVKHVRFGKNSLDTDSTVPAEAARPSESPVHDQDLHSNLENTWPDKNIGAQDGRTISSDQENGTQDGKTVSSDIGNQPGRNVMDLKKFTSDVLAQADQQLGIRIAGPTFSEEIMVDNNLPEKEANAVPNLFPTVAFTDNKSSKNNEPISYHRNPFVDVNGYKVKRNLAPLLSAIFKKHGDIARKSAFSTKSRSCLLELVCSIYNTLEASTFVHLPPSDMKSMLDQICDLELVKVEVGWLRKRLEEISKAREIVDGASTLEDVKEKTVLVISEKRKAVETYEKELEAGMDAMKKLQGTLQQEKDELAFVLTVADEIEQLYGGSLVHGLV